MNLKLIKDKLNTLQSQGGGKFNHLFWKPKLGKHVIRIIPAKSNKDFPFTELLFHYGIGNRTMIALNNFGEPDPIVEFTEGLKRQEYDVENFKMAKKLEPKMRVFAPVIVRGEEDKGVRLWGFGKEVYKELCAIAEDEDAGDYTDVSEGRDIIVEVSKQEGKAFNNTSVRVKTKQTPISEDAKQVKEWLTNQPEPIACFDRVEYDDIKRILTEWLSASPAEEESKEADEDEDEVLPTPSKSLSAPAPKAKNPYTLEGVKKKISVNDELDKLFADNKK